jgi:hypothetical protein
MALPDIDFRPSCPLCYQPIAFGTRRCPHCAGRLTTLGQPDEDRRDSGGSYSSSSDGPATHDHSDGGGLLIGLFGLAGLVWWVVLYLEVSGRMDRGLLFILAHVYSGGRTVDTVFTTATIFGFMFIPVYWVIKALYPLMKNVFQPTGSGNH